METSQPPESTQVVNRVVFGKGVGVSCMVCTSPIRTELEAKLIDPTLSIRSIETYAKISRSSLLRHRANCMPLALARREQNAVRKADESLNHALALRAKRIEKLQAVADRIEPIILRQLENYSEAHKADTKLLTEYRKIMEHAAREMGTFGSNDAVGGAGGSNTLIILPQHTPPGGSAQITEAPIELDITPQMQRALNIVDNTQDATPEE